MKIDISTANIERHAEEFDACYGPEEAGLLRSLCADRDALAARLADAELSLAVFDAGSNSEYWLRHPAAAGSQE